MGSEGSAPRGVHTEPYYIIGDGHNNVPQGSSTTDFVHAQRITKTGFFGVWSMFAPKARTPVPRMSQFMVEMSQTNTAVCGYGIDTDNNYLNDVWELNLATREWTDLRIDTSSVSPRSGAAAVRIARKICVFGGFDGSRYFADFHVIDLETRTVFRPEFTNDGPPERIGHVMAVRNNVIVVWGGYNGDWLNDLWILDLSNFTWQMMPSDIKGRIGTAWANHGDYLYIFGASKSDPLLRFNWSTHIMQTVATTGAAPPAQLSQASMVALDRYLLVIGGKYDNNYGLVYGFDTVKERWFIFHVVPDGETTTVTDGSIDKFGHFMVPRSWSVSMVYRAETRQVVMFLGAPLIDPPNVGILEMGEALSVKHLQIDMLGML